VLWACAAAVAVSGCGPTRLTVKPEIPPLLIKPMPLAMGVRIPKSFAEYVQKETGETRRWEIKLGAGQADAIRRVTAAMFEHTLALGDQAPGDAAAIAAHKLNAILETTLDSYVYLLPTSGGADYYSATIGYKVNLLSVDGTVLGSWIYEGYGSAPSRGLGDSAGVKLVTGLAIRDACANLAVHLPDQELVRNLLAPPATTPTATVAPTPSADSTPAGGATSSTKAAATGGALQGSGSVPTTGATPTTGAIPIVGAAPTIGALPTTGVTPTAESPPLTEPTQSPTPTLTPTPTPTPAPPATTTKPTAVETPPTIGN
jgi:hypothetical protein